MPITRTAMIDDDGSGTTGTIINNAWKQELYNQIDGVAGSSWLDHPFAAADYTALAPMVWTVEAGDVTSNWYRFEGGVLTWNCTIQGSTLSGTATNTFDVKLPAAKIALRPAWAIGKCYQATGGWKDLDIVATAAKVVINKVDGTAFAVPDGNVWVHFQIEIAC